MNDRRKHRRLDLHLPITFRREGSSRPLTTTTRNISTGGVCFELVTSMTLAIGNEFDVEISVPPTEANLAPITLICGKGRVCRVDPGDEQAARPRNLCIAMEFASPLQLSL